MNQKDAPKEETNGTKVEPTDSSGENDIALERTASEQVSDDEPKDDGSCSPPDAEEKPEIGDPLEQAELANTELKDKLLRAMAETENLRRRSEREMKDLRKYAITDFARDILSVADNLKRAIAAAEAINTDKKNADTDADVTQMLEGVLLTEKQLTSTLEKYGVTEVNPLGEKLDPNRHQAMIQIEDQDAVSGTIIQVMQAGYLIHDRLLRAAMVGVAKNPDKDESHHQVDAEA